MDASVNITRPLVGVVDDEETVCRALERLLRSAGFNVATFGSAADFLKSLETRRPACLVLDLCMPQMSGFDLQERLVRMEDPVPIVTITGQDSPHSQTRVLHAGAAAYLRKPVDAEALLEAVHKAISSKAP
jgi:FixJ family two-component response regulator